MSIPGKGKKKKTSLWQKPKFEKAGNSSYKTHNVIGGRWRQIAHNSATDAIAAVGVSAHQELHCSFLTLNFPHNEMFVSGVINSTWSRQNNPPWLSVGPLIKCAQSQHKSVFSLLSVIIKLITVDGGQ